MSKLENFYEKFSDHLDSIVSLGTSLSRYMPEEKAEIFIQDFFNNIPGIKTDFVQDFFSDPPKIKADLSLVLPKFLHWLLVDETHGVINFAENDEIKITIKNVADLLYKQIIGEEITQKQWSDAAADAHADDAEADAARAAADAAYAANDADAFAAAAATYTDKAVAFVAFAAAAAYDADAAYAANDAANAASAAAAAAAAYAAANAVDADAYDGAAKENHILQQAEKLLELLKDAK